MLGEISGWVQIGPFPVPIEQPNRGYVSVVLLGTVNLVTDAFEAPICGSGLNPREFGQVDRRALMEVIRQAHRSPDCRNIRPNPCRADQVQVLARDGGERWEMLTLVEAVGLLFRDAAASMVSLAGSDAGLHGLTPEERTASFLMPAEYGRQPEKYERAGRRRLAAHLASLGACQEKAVAPV